MDQYDYVLVVIDTSEFGQWLQKTIIMICKVIINRRTHLASTDVSI
jgi:hypothetical protein